MNSNKHQTKLKAHTKNKTANQIYFLLKNTCQQKFKFKLTNKTKVKKKKENESPQHKTKQKMTNNKQQTKKLNFLHEYFDHFET